MVAAVVLSPNSTLSSVITHKQVFYRDKSAGCFENRTFFILLLHGIFHRDNNFDNVCVRARVRHITMCASGYVFSARAHAYACCNSKRKINGLFVSGAAEQCIKCADLPNERQKLFTGVL